MLPESFLIEHLIQANNEENSKFKSKSSSDSSPMVSSNESLSEQPICKFSEKHFDEKTDTRILNTSPPPELKGKREIGFLNKCTLTFSRFSDFIIYLLIHSLYSFLQCTIDDLMCKSAASTPSS